MDVLKLLKSFEELVYEALAWLVLLPWTLLRAVVSPRRMTRYAREELDREGEDRFDRAVSPPLALMLCVLLAHAIDLALRPTPAAAAEGTLATRTPSRSTAPRATAIGAGASPTRPAGSVTPPYGALGTTGLPRRRPGRS